MQSIFGARVAIVRRDRAGIAQRCDHKLFRWKMLLDPFYAVRNGQSTFLASAQNNIPFEINYDPTYIDPNDQYELKAQIVSGNRIILSIEPAGAHIWKCPDRCDSIGSCADASDDCVLSVELAVVTAGYGSGVSETLAAQYNQVYRRYLGRDPYPVEMAAFMLFGQSAGRSRCPAAESDGWSTVL